MILGLTGFSGAGKSTVAALLIEQGFYHIDCDRLVHSHVYRDPAVLDALADSFGPQILCGGKLNRKALRSQTMGNPAALQKLNDTVMPFILAHIHAELRAHAGEDIVLDAPLLFETGLDRECDRVLSVITTPELAMERIIRRDGLTRAEAEKRLSSQHPPSYYVEKSDYVIVNNEELPALKEKTLELLKKIHDAAL